MSRSLGMALPTVVFLLLVASTCAWPAVERETVVKHTAEVERFNAAVMQYLPLVTSLPADYQQRVDQALGGPPTASVQERVDRIDDALAGVAESIRVFDRVYRIDLLNGVVFDCAFNSLKRDRPPAFVRTRAALATKLEYHRLYQPEATALVRLRAAIVDRFPTAVSEGEGRVVSSDPGGKTVAGLVDYLNSHFKDDSAYEEMGWGPFVRGVLGFEQDPQSAIEVLGKLSHASFGFHCAVEVLPILREHALQQRPQGRPPSPAG